MVLLRTTLLGIACVVIGAYGNVLLHRYAYKEGTKHWGFRKLLYRFIARTGGMAMLIGVSTGTGILVTNNPFGLLAGGIAVLISFYVYFALQSENRKGKQDSLTPI